MNRRTFLHCAAGLAAASGWGDDPAPALRVVDAHTHFYDPRRKEGVPWPEKGSWLYRPVYPQDWLAVAAPFGARETVVIEASVWLEDNAWVLDLAAKEPSIVGFVGHLLPHQGEFPAQLKRFAANPIFRGIRVNQTDFLQNVASSEFKKGAALMADLGLTLDLNGPREMLAPAAALAADLPALRIVIDHAGSAGDPSKLSKEWRELMARFEQRTNVFCKVSALIEQTDEAARHFGQAPRETAYYAPILDHLWNHFGSGRLVYGSNWPVSEKGGTYADQFKVVHEYFGAKGREASERYFRTNSQAAYRWVERGGK
jgi:predicted TIM-barrel fold metal-dependent hydrolase